MRVPSMDEIWEVAEARGANSEAPHLWRGLLVAYPFQDGGSLIAKDIGSLGYNGDLTAMALSSWALTPYGRGLNFDGFDDRVIFAPASGLDFGTVHAMSLWFNPNVNNTQVIVGHIAYDNGGYFATIDASNVYYSANGSFVSVPFSGYAGKWKNLAVRRQNLNVRFYDCGKLIYAEQTLTANTPLQVSSIGDYRNSTYPFNGLITHVLMWKDIIPTEDDLRMLYADPWAMYRVRPRVLVRGVTLPTKKKYYVVEL